MLCCQSVHYSVNNVAVIAMLSVHRATSLPVYGVHLSIRDVCCAPLLKQLTTCL